MVGNDIIDRELAATESNWRRHGFLEKIFTVKEQKFVASSSNPDLVVWLMWSMKESAYKIVNRRTGVRKFNPNSYEAKLTSVQTDTAQGLVYYQNLQFTTRSTFSTQVIDTIAVEQVCLLNYITDVQDDQEIVKIGNLPFYKHFNFVSTSHHGRFKRAVFLNPELVL